MAETDDIKFMRRCIELASKAEGLTYPNPLVGSVIVYEDRIIGEGFHLKAGEPHAEVLAINSVRDKALLKYSTLYVNLEPCSHFGKTPPCADFIVSSSIPRVVIGTTDTSEKVSGEGLLRLRNAGCEVITGVAEEESRRINRRFFTYHEKKRPYITLKWAESADGFIDMKREKESKAGPNWITGKPERALVHRWRSMEQAILVGAGTLRADNPKLNVRDWHGNNPIRLVLSSSGDLANIRNGDIKGSLIVFTHKIDAISGVASQVKLDNSRPSSIQIVEYLYQKGIQSLFIEGGAQVLNHFISSELWDEARIFTGGMTFKDGVRAPVRCGTLLSKKKYSGSTLKHYVPNIS